MMKTVKEKSQRTKTNFLILSSYSFQSFILIAYKQELFNATKLLTCAENIFSCVHATLQPALSVGQSVTLYFFLSLLFL